MAGWLPLFHDKGLIGNVLYPIYFGGTSTLMSPTAFLQRPVRWLRAISHYRTDYAGGPNFGFELCSRRVTESDLSGLDLSCWEMAFVGAEPVRPATLDRFSQVFAPVGFRPQALFPTYGLAEATLMATGGARLRPLTTSSFSASLLSEGRVVAPEAASDSVALVGCGRTVGHQELRIVDPESRLECEAGQIGEIWLRGPNVAGGYWNLPEETEHTFRARLRSGDGPYLRTGDLGFLIDGELYIKGRLKDLIIVRGRNYYPQDIEEVVERFYPAVRLGCVAAFSVDAEDEERVVIVAEGDYDRTGGDSRELADAVHGAIVEEHGLKPLAIVFIDKGTIPKTSSGKIRRRACKAAFLAGTLRESARFVA
jgi:acyl-CoA synthetase (AMP-forming)/AMP-acid ligase II